MASEEQEKLELETNPLGAEPELVRPSDGAELSIDVPPGKRAAATFIFLTVTMDMLALGMIAPVLPRLITGFMSGNAVNAAQMLGIFGTVFAGIQFLFSPVLGSISDRFGRRPVVLLSNFGLGLDYLLMAWAPALGWLFVGRVVSGLRLSGCSARRSGWASCWDRRWAGCWEASIRGCRSGWPGP
jgi:DHA1 family tetracycline resistance protein-like MFS transporter